MAEKENEMSFEEVMAELEQIVRELESGKVKLDDALKAYERGAALRKIAEDKLASAKMKIEKIALASDGTVVGADEFKVVGEDE